MESTARWLVCAGPDEFLFIASALVAAGSVGGIEWEPVPSRAYVRAAQAAVSGGVNAIVGSCLGDEDPMGVACTLAGLADGATVLCSGSARFFAEQVAARGVTAAVEPGALLRFLLGMGRRRDGENRPALGLVAEPARPGDGCADGAYAGDDLEEPAAFAWPGGYTGAPTVCDGAAPVAGAGLQAERSMEAPPIRARGRLPHTGVDARPRTARPLADLPAVPHAEGAEGCRPAGDACGSGDAAAPRPDRVPLAPHLAQAAAASRSDRAPSASQPDQPPVAPCLARPPIESRSDQAPLAPAPVQSLATPSPVQPTPVFPTSPGRVVAGIATEPVAYRPVITLPQLECDVAGADEHVPTVCFASSRGGVGKTALAVLTALALARDGLSVALIDLDFQFGTCLGYLGAEETDGLMDVGALPEQVRVDARTLARCRATPERCLAAYEFCRAPEQAEALAGMAARLVRTARAGADVAVVDLPSGVNEVVAQVLDVSDRCLLVSDQRAFALESLASQQSLCARMGVARTKLVTVMNRCDPRHRDEGFLSRVQFEVQTPQVVRVVDGGVEVMQMLSIGSAGELLAMRNRFALSTADLAHALCADLGCQPAAPSAPPRFAPVAAPSAAPLARGVFRRHRKERRGEQVPCPF